MYLYVTSAVVLGSSFRNNPSRENSIPPGIKISSNQSPTNLMVDIIDFNTGTIIIGEDTIEAKEEELLEYIIKDLSGEELPAAVRISKDDFIPWKRSVSL